MKAILLLFLSLEAANFDFLRPGNLMIYTNNDYFRPEAGIGTGKGDSFLNNERGFLSSLNFLFGKWDFESPDLFESLTRRAWFRTRRIYRPGNDFAVYHENEINYNVECPLLTDSNEAINDNNVFITEYNPLLDLYNEQKFTDTEVYWPRSLLKFFVPVFFQKLTLEILNKYPVIRRLLLYLYKFIMNKREPSENI